MVRNKFWSRISSFITVATLIVSSVQGGALAAIPSPVTSTATAQRPAEQSAQAPVTASGPSSKGGTWTDPSFQSAQDLFLSQIVAETAIEEDLLANYAQMGDQSVIIIVQLSDPDVVSYAGGIAGLAPTAPTGVSPFNAQAPASQAYMAYLANKQAEFAKTVAQVSPSAKVVANYTAALNGLALSLPASDVAQVSALAGVAGVYKNEIAHIDTDRGPTWIGAPAVWAQLGGQANAGKDILVGIIDSGLWSANPLSSTLVYTNPHPSFSGEGYTLPFTNTTNTAVITQTLGVCHPTSPQASDGTFACNNKVVGGYWYNSSGIAWEAEFHSPLDNGGHGSHTGSTVAGNVVTATVLNNPLALVSGMAPAARIIAYKVCWEADPADANDGGCSSADSASAIDQAILNGVNVLNFSISGGTSPTTDVVELAFLRARKAGIFVSASAGNSGPTASTVAHLSPWLNTSAAMQHDRAFRSTVVVTSTVGTPTTGLKGASVTAGKVGKAVLAPLQAGDTFYPSRCMTPYAAGTFQSTDIVICRRGVNARVAKAANVAAGGAGGFILVNASNNQGLAYDSYVIPGVHLEYNATSYSTAGNDLVTYLMTVVPTNVVTITLSGGQANYDANIGDVVASFSSRGPTGLNIIKPDNAAPGVAILAGYTPNGYVTTNIAGEQFAFLNGTSMSSPHTAGAGAILKSLYPTWTPAQIQSALMTSATPILKEDGVTPANPFDQGTGRLTLAKAISATLLFDVPNSQFDEYVADTRKIENINLPSLAQMQCAGTCSWTRVAKSIISPTATYTWSVLSATPGLVVSLDQNSYTATASSNLTFTVTANVVGLPVDGAYAYARIVLRETTTGIETAIPVAVIRVRSQYDTKLSFTTPRDQGGNTFNILSGDTFANIYAVRYGLTAAKVTPATALGGDDQAADSNPLDPAYGWFLTTQTLPSSLGRYVVTTGDSNASDIDLFLLLDLDGNKQFDYPDDVIASSAGGSANEKVDLLNLQAYAGKQVLIAVYNWSGEVNASFNVRTWQVTPTTDNSLQVSGLPSSLAPNDTINPLVTFNKAMTPGQSYYGLVNIGNADIVNDVATVMINVVRTDSEVVKTSNATASVGEVLTYTIVLKNQDTTTRTFTLTDALPSGVTYIPGSLSGAGATYSDTLNAVLVSAVIPGQVLATNYSYEDNVMAADLATKSPWGGYVDLPTDYGFSPVGLPAGGLDDSVYSFANTGCNWTLYGTNSGATNGHRIGFSTNGLYFPGNSAGGTISGTLAVTSTIPTAAPPNAFIAALWANLTLSPTAVLTPALYAASSGACPNRAIVYQFANIHPLGNDNTLLNYELQADTTVPNEYWVLYGNISGTVPGAVVGVENWAGDLGLAYPGTITSNRVIHYYRPLIAAPPITVTFQVTVSNGLNVGNMVTNTANYMVDAANTGLIPVKSAFQVGTSSASPSPNTSQPAGAGKAMTYTLYVTNTGTLTDTFDVSLNGFSFLPSLSSYVVGPLGPGGAPAGPQQPAPAAPLPSVGSVVLSVAIPATAANGQSSTTTVAFTSRVDPSKTYTVGVTTTAVNVATDLTISAPGTALVNTTVMATARVTDTGGLPMANQPVLFSANQFGAALSGLNEAPIPVTTTAGTGALSFTYDPATQRLTYIGSVSGLTTNVSAAHIHTGTVGVPGSVLFPLTYVTSTNGATFAGVVTLTTASEALLYTGGLYVNVHTATNPGGEVRGNILDGTFTALLAGAYEVPPVATTGVGAIYFTFNPATNGMSYTGQVAGLSSNVTNAHIHTGAVGVAGPPIISLTYITTTNGAVFSGSLNMTETVALNTYLAGGLYVNVHTTNNSGGEVRGQIMVGTTFVTDAEGKASAPVTKTSAGPVTVTAITGGLKASTTITFVQYKLYLPLISR